jgi:hypothetical protein
MAIVANPKSYIATASGDNELLPVDDQGRNYVILAIAVFATSSTPVSFYIHSGSTMLLGDSTNKLTVDLVGIGGPNGFVLPYSEGGWFAATASGAISINLSAAVPVIVQVAYSFR